jgi:hypothetical protein
MRSEVRDEIREFREENNRLLSEVRADMTSLRQKLDVGFQNMQAGFNEMCERLDAFVADQRQIADMVATLVAQRGGKGHDRARPSRQ